MRRKLDLALAHEPGILSLDQPTTDLGPASRRQLGVEVKRLQGG